MDERAAVNEQKCEREGYKIYSVKDQQFEIPQRYTLLHCIGRGAFGTVCSSKVAGSDAKVAVKKVHIREDNILEVKRLVREVYLLYHFKHENLIGLQDIIEICNPEQFEDIYLVTDLMDTDLHRIIRSKQLLSEDHVQFFLYQILRGLKAMHSAQVLHRDLKPSNIVVNSNCDLKICDFGLAREQSVEMTDYVATRWYRAPELLLQWKCYSGAVDCWSAGCILAEMLLRKPLLPGRHYLEQLHYILDLVGTPEEEDIKGIGTEKARQYVSRLRPRRSRRDLRPLLPMASEPCIQLLSQLLLFNPADRLTAAQALAHPYFAAMHDVADEPDAPVFSFDMDLGSSNVTIPELKAALLRLVARFHPECPGTPGGPSPPPCCAHGALGDGAEDPLTQELSLLTLS